MHAGTGTEDVTKETDDESGLIILLKNHLFVYRI